MKFRFLPAALILISALAHAYPQPCDHPRLLLHAGEEEEIRLAIETQPVMAEADSAILAYCDETLYQPPHPRRMAGFRIERMQVPLQRIFYLSYAYRVHGDRRYADRAIEEMLNTAEYEDWNPGHFLDVAEITMGMAIGYDWLYDEMTAEQRRKVASAISRHGLDASKIDKDAWFYTAFQNWNQVCNAGLVFGAIAVWDEYRDDAVIILDKCFDSNYLTLTEGYSKEGAYAEGYGYWGYGSAFQILLIAALESAFGSDMGLMDGHDRFFRSGTFMQMMNRPTGLCFDYADSGREAAAEHMLAWLAVKTGDESLLYPEVQKLRKNHFSRMDMQRLLPFFLISARKIDFAKLQVPDGRFFTTGGLTPLYIYRSGWESEDDTYLGIKAGLISSNHSHCDVGSFVFDADGVTWADDLGLQPYLSLESKGVDLWNRWQNSSRYDVFRIGPFSHNIITVNGHRPDVYQYIDFTRTWCEDAQKGAEMNLKMLYWEDLKDYRRTVILLGEDDAELLVKDELRAGDHPAIVRWNLCTTAQAEILDDTCIRLFADGHERLLRLEGCNGKAAIWSAQPGTDIDYPNPDNVLVGFTVDLEAGESAVMNVSLKRIK